MSRSLEPRVGRRTDALAPTAPQTSGVSPGSPAASPRVGILQELSWRGRKPSGFGFAMIGASFASAVEAVWANRLRSLLTMLGIFIGVAAVIGAFTLTQGVNQYVTNLISSLGTNTIIVFPGTSQSRGVKSGTNSSLTLTRQEWGRCNSRQSS